MNTPIINNIGKENKLNLLQEYIIVLTQNIEPTLLPSELNIVFDGGIFNGLFAIGVALYVKTIEHQKRIKVNMVSGCSAGSVMALWYVCGCNIDIIDIIDNFIHEYKKDIVNIRKYHEAVEILVMRILPTDECVADKLNNKLFINYYDTKRNKQRVISRFSSRKHVITCILRSSHVPYITNNQSRFEDRYIDGIVPYTFPFGHNLFIQVVTIRKLTRALLLKSENNIHFRIMAGVADANDFFTTGVSDMCSYMENWSYLKITSLHIREFILVLMCAVIDYLVYLHKNLPRKIRKSLLYSGSINALKGLGKDICMKTLV